MDDTPLMQQWRDAKSRHPDALIFFRVGDFYEMFCEDAEEGARLLGLALTTRNNGGAANVALAGVPVRARDAYIERLLRLGRRVAICEQVEDPAEAKGKGIVRREVIETVTPGALLADALLAQRRNNFLVALAEDETGRTGVAAADISTGEVLATTAGTGSFDEALARFEPSELLLPRAWEGRAQQAADAVVRTYRPDWLFEHDIAADEVRRRYRVQSLDGFDFQPQDRPLVCALGALLAYLAEVQPTALDGLRPPRIERQDSAMALDEMTRRNLELTELLRPAGPGSGRPATLIETIDETLTPMGARALRQWLLRPLVVAAAIWERQQAVAELHDDPTLRRTLRRLFAPIRDLERLATKVGSARVQPRELVGLRDSLAQLPMLKDALASTESSLLARLRDQLDTLDDVRDLIGRGLADEPAVSPTDGDVVRAGHDEELDVLRTTRDGAQDTIAQLQAQERERTGIASLKVGYNKVFGYFLEVTRANLARIPADYERKQTLANAERFVTSELKRLEAALLDAAERITDVETRLFGELRRDVAAHVGRIQATAASIAVLDVVAAFAHHAERNDYVRPEVQTGFALEIRGGRHPVVETMMPREMFIPNDVVLDEDGFVMILTGPNMAGKSTLLRQVGLIQLLAQAGAFVPARMARLPVCDRIFTRVGASDNLVRGQSTFMVEMQETAAILHGATRASLVLLDEIGRGTATFDGVSIAWAVTEFIHERLGAKTIFATHYHELTQLAELLRGVINFNVAVREAGQDIVFLHNLQPGGADRSYGIEVGRLAGLPHGVVDRARDILHDLEGVHTRDGVGLGRRGETRPAGAPPADQLSLFHAIEPGLLERLRSVQVDRTTPLDALNLLAELVAAVRSED